MPVIWGLDLHEMQWYKFKSSYMFNRDYHLRRTKMVVYQIAMIMCVVSESVGTDVISNYLNQQDRVDRLPNSAGVYNNDIVGILSFNIFNGIYIATIFGAGFFFDLFWPERHESKSVRFAWKFCAALAVVMCLAEALAFTVILATKSARVTGDSIIDIRAGLAAAYNSPHLVYRKNGEAIASLVLLWVGWVATVASTVILMKSHQHDEIYGPKSTHLRVQEIEAKKRAEASPSTTMTSPTRSHNSAV